jgi:cell wall-associated NlpC family hydrolase
VRTICVLNPTTPTGATPDGVGGRHPGGPIEVRRADDALETSSTTELSAAASTVIVPDDSSRSGWTRRSRGRRRVEDEMMPQRSRSSFVQSEALVAACEAAVAPRRGRRAADVPADPPKPAAAAPTAAKPEPAPRRVARVDRAATRLPSTLSTPRHPVRRAGAVVKKLSLVAALIGFAASGTLPLLATSDDSAQATASGPGSTTSASGQAFSVDPSVVTSDISRDDYSATSMLDVQTQLLLNRTAAVTTTYDGPTTADYLAAPLHDELDRSEVFTTALQYVGTPYVHGGEDPSKFDCSGLITFVYAQFGISLTHYVPAQDAAGTRIAEADAVPGDLVVFDNLAHDGIYAGNGMILDAPKPGGFVSVRPIWDQPHHFVRIAG